MPRRKTDYIPYSPWVALNKLMKTYFNLPPGCSTRDIDPPCCGTCEGSGEVEGKDGEIKICPACDGTGKPDNDII